MLDDDVRRRSCDRCRDREELQGALEEWNEMFKKHGLKTNLDKQK